MDEFVKGVHDLENTIYEIANNFYQQNDKTGYKLFADSYTQLLNIVDRIVQEDDKILINSCLNNALEALELKDTVLLADILKYDLIELLINIIDKGC